MLIFDTIWIWVLGLVLGKRLNVDDLGNLIAGKATRGVHLY